MVKEKIILDHPEMKKLKEPITSMGSFRWIRDTIEMEQSISEEYAKMSSLEMMDHLYNLGKFNKELCFSGDRIIHKEFIKNNILRIQYIINKLMDSYVEEVSHYTREDGRKVITQLDAVRIVDRIHMNMYHYMYHMIPGCPDYRKYSTIDDYPEKDRVHMLICEGLSNIKKETELKDHRKEIRNALLHIDYKESK